MPSAIYTASGLKSTAIWRVPSPFFRAHHFDKDETTSINAYLSSLYLLKLQQDEAEQFDAALGTAREMRSIDEPFSARRSAGAAGLSLHGRNRDRAPGQTRRGGCDLQRHPASVGTSRRAQFAALCIGTHAPGIDPQHCVATATARQALFDTTKNRPRPGTANLCRLSRHHRPRRRCGCTAAGSTRRGQGNRCRTRIPSGTSRRSWAKPLAQAGKIAEARDMLRTARDAFLRWGVPGTAATIGCGRALGKFFARGRGETAAAVAEFPCRSRPNAGRVFPHRLPARPPGSLWRHAPQATRVTPMRAASMPCGFWRRRRRNMMCACVSTYGSHVRRVLQALGRTAEAPRCRSPCSRRCGCRGCRRHSTTRATPTPWSPGSPPPEAKRPAWLRDRYERRSQADQDPTFRMGVLNRLMPVFCSVQPPRPRTTSAA